MTSNQVSGGILLLFATAVVLIYACSAKDAPIVLRSGATNTYYAGYVRVETNGALYAHGKLIGTLTTNSFMPAPPGLNEGIQLGIMAARRNPDVRDMRVLVPVALQLWEEIQRGRQL